MNKIGEELQAWVFPECVFFFCRMYILPLGGENVLCILSKLQQFGVKGIAVMLLGFLNYPSSFDLPNLLICSLIIIFIRNDWQ